MITPALILIPSARAQSVVIHEIHYHPASDNSQEEYIELYNLGESPVDLQGWQFTDGVAYLLPAITIQSHEPVVVAADRAVFRQVHPNSSPASVVGDWSGKLSNSSEAIVLRDSRGEIVDEVHYADEGPWASRQRGDLDRQHRGWEWAAAHDGRGPSLELRNPAMTNGHGHNWKASHIDGGTPGARNSVRADDLPPMIQSPTHRPIVPTSSDPVHVSVRVIDEAPGTVRAALHYRIDGKAASEFTTVPMTAVDSGADAPQSRLLQAEIPPQPDNTIVEFFIEARDASESTRRWPAPAQLPDGSSAQTANLLYQVDNDSHDGAQPLYKIIMTAAERAELDAIGSAPLTGAAKSNAEMNGTFISVDGTGTQIRYLVGIRNRGQGTRNRQPNNYQVNFRSDIPWKEQTELNLNAQYSYAQHIGAVLSLHAGVPSGFATAVQLRVNNDDATLSGPRTRTYGSYVAKEALNSEFVDRHFPEDGGGNLYKGFRDNEPADLGYRGPDYQAYTNSYSKETNRSEADWSDLLELTRTLNNAPKVDYTQEAKRVAVVRQWMRYFAMMALFNNRESNLSTGFGDDYYLYRGEADRRFRLISHDLDTILGEGDHRGSTEAVILGKGTIFGAINMPTFDRLLRWPPFSRLYYRQLIDLSQTTFSSNVFNPLIEETLADYVPPEVVQRMQDWAAARRQSIRQLIPQTIEVSPDLPTKNGFFHTTQPSITLRGRANALKTGAVRVEGESATWTAFKAEWKKENVALDPGINRVLIESLDPNGSQFDRKSVEVWYEAGSTTPVRGELTQDTRWSPEQGSYLVQNRVTVPAETTLTIEPGTTVYFQSGAGIEVQGRLVAAGSDVDRIRLSGPPENDATWDGIRLVDAQTKNRLAFVDIRSTAADRAAVSTENATVQIHRSTFADIGGRAIEASRSSLEIRDCIFSSQPYAMIFSDSLLASDPFLEIVGNEFGKITGSDEGAVVHHAPREADTVIQIRRNRFSGGRVSAIHLESANAFIQANRFGHFGRSGSAGAPPVSSIVADMQAHPHLVRNFFFDNDYALLIRGDSFATLEHNTIFGSAIAAIDFHRKNAGTPGRGAAISGTIFAKNASVLEDAYRSHPTWGKTEVRIDYSLLPADYHGFGSHNAEGGPRFVNPPDDFHLRPGSPAINAGPNGSDIGAQVPDGPRITGEPGSPTPQTEAILGVSGPGLTHYRYRLDQNPLSRAIPISEPIVLSDLEAGWHQVHVIGRDATGVWQDKRQATPSDRWQIDPASPALKINELLARNDSIRHNGELSDLVELYNPSDSPINLTGYRLTDDLTEPHKFVFPEGVTLPGRTYLVLQADDDDEGAGLHLGFALDGDGEALHLLDRPGNGGRELDSVKFGPQITDLSIGRIPETGWGLTQPTFGKPNVAQPVGNPTALVINEWLTDTSQSGFEEDFVEIHNPEALPVALGKLALTDAPNTTPLRHNIAPLTFIPANGYRVFIADSQPQGNANHLDFRLSPDSGMLALFQTRRSEIDRVVYGPQTTDVSQGPKETGKGLYRKLPEPTPGADNPDPRTGEPIVLNEVSANTSTGLVGAPSKSDWVELYNPGATSVDLSQFSLSDRLSGNRQWRFPEATAIAPGEYLVIELDQESPSSGANINLDRHGDSLYLLDSASESRKLIDSISFGPLPRNRSIGRMPESRAQWQLTRRTPREPNQPAQLSPASSLKVNEWMARPDSGEDWLELYNPNSHPVDIGGFFLTDDPNEPRQYQLPAHSFIGAGADAFLKFEADDRPPTGPTHLNFKLSGEGESIGLFSSGQAAIDIIRFDEQADGVSQGRLPDGKERIAQFRRTRSPEASNYLPLAIRINEVLSNTKAPLEDAIELHNPTDSPVRIGGWHLSDTAGNFTKYRIPADTVIPGNGFHVIYEQQLDGGAGSISAFDLNGIEDQSIYLSAVDQTGDLTGHRTHFPLVPTTLNTSLGRHATSDGQQLARMRQPTFGIQRPITLKAFRLGTGRPNAYPLISPLVISEIMYHPPETGSQANASQFEFIELQNRQQQSVSLGDAEWRLQEGIRFDLPEVTLPAFGTLVVVAFEPSEGSQALAAFQDRYDLSGDSVIVGPYNGRLDNAGERVVLSHRASPRELEGGQPNQPVYVSMDAINYSDDLPWPTDADGDGASLKRLDGWLYPNDPMHWTAAPPTPGYASAEDINADRDNDGISNRWEVNHGLDPMDATDGALDADDDGQTNRQEYASGTHPWDQRSRLELSSIRRQGDTITITFTAVAGRSYTLLRTSSLETSAWKERKHIEAQATTGRIKVRDAIDSNDQDYFYRLAASRP